MAHQYTDEQRAKKASITYLKSEAARLAFPKKSKITIQNLIQLEKEIKGRIVYPWSPTYEFAKKEFNDVYPAYPELIVYVENYSDIRQCLAIARDLGLWTAVRSGGHSLAGYSVCDGMVIDMRHINNVYVDTNAQTAFVESGTRFHKLFPILENYGLHVPGGGCPGVAVAGYMQGGGYGLTSRAFGIQCDNVIEVSVMLADGQIVIANKDQNQDLLWAICGGTGGNFGVLLSITYKLVKLGNIFGTKISWEITDSADNASLALLTIQNNYLTPNTYPNMGIETILCHDFDMDDPNDQGIKKVYFCSSWIGNEEDYQEALAPLLALPGANVVIDITEGSYSDINAMVLEGTPQLPWGIKAYARSTYFANFLSQDNWRAILQFYSTSPNRYTMVDMECYGGAIDDLPVGSNAFIHRNVTMDFFCDAFFNEETNDQKENEKWLEDFFEFLAQFSNGHSYQNYPNRLQKDYKWAYWGNYYDQLCNIKAKYDPSNFFNFQQSIGSAEEEKLNDQLIIFKNSAIVYETP